MFNLLHPLSNNIEFHCNHLDGYKRISKKKDVKLWSNPNELQRFVVIQILQQSIIFYTIFVIHLHLYNNLPFLTQTELQKKTIMTYTNYVKPKKKKKKNHDQDFWSYFDYHAHKECMPINLHLQNKDYKAPMIRWTKIFTIHSKLSSLWNLMMRIGK